MGAAREGQGEKGERVGVAECDVQGERGEGMRGEGGRGAEKGRRWAQYTF